MVPIVMTFLNETKVLSTKQKLFKYFWKSDIHKPGFRIFFIKLIYVCFPWSSLKTSSFWFQIQNITNHISFLETLRIKCCDQFPAISKEQINSHMLVTGKSSAELILQVAIQVVFIRKTQIIMYSVCATLFHLAWGFQEIFWSHGKT